MMKEILITFGSIAAIVFGAILIYSNPWGWVAAIRSQTSFRKKRIPLMRPTYSKSPTLTSKPKDQRSIIADVLLQAVPRQNSELSINQEHASSHEVRHLQGGLAV
jgi:hypothetical protein